MSFVVAIAHFGNFISINTPAYIEGMFVVFIFFNVCTSRFLAENRPSRLSSGNSIGCDVCFKTAFRGATLFNTDNLTFSAITIGWYCIFPLL